MFVLHASIKVKPGHEGAAQSVFAEAFKQAISTQPGFKDVDFLTPLEGDEYVLAIIFESHALQQEWVATDLHTQVWSQMEAHFDSWAVKTYRSGNLLESERRLR